jgi:hypothetical protein
VPIEIAIEIGVIGEDSISNRDLNPDPDPDPDPD